MLSSNSADHTIDSDIIELDLSTSSAAKELSLEYPNWQKLVSRIMTFASVGVQPLFSYFLYVACLNAVTEVFKESDENNREILLVTFNVASTILILFNLLSDLTDVNPVEEAENALDILHALRNSDVEVSSKEKVTNALTRVSQVLSLPNYLLSSASEAIAVSYLLSGIGVRNIGINLTLGLPIAALGVTNLYMFSGHNIHEHIKALIDETANRFPSFKRIYQSPARFAEATIQVSCNIAYRGVMLGYFVDELLKVIHGPTSDSFNLGLIATGVALSSFDTLQCRTLQVYRRFFKNENLVISPERLQNIELPKLGMIIDLAIALSRGVPLGLLLYRHNPFNDLDGALALSSTIGLISFAHNYYSQFQVRMLDVMASKEFENQVVIVAQQKNNNEKTKTELFDEIVDYYRTKTYIKVSHIVNLGARASRLISFVGFLFSLQSTLQKNNVPINFDAEDILCLASIWGIPTFSAEYKAMQNEFQEIWPYYRAKLRIGKPTEKSLDLFGLFSSKKQYDRGRLLQVLEEISCEREEATRLLPSSSML